MKEQRREEIKKKKKRKKTKDNIIKNKNHSQQNQSIIKDIYKAWDRLTKKRKYKKKKDIARI